MTSPTIEFAFSYCPRCAAANEHVGKIPFHCCSCNLVLYFGPVAAVGGLVVNDAGELLLVRRAKDPGKGMFGLPGGFIDRDETAEAALEREILEETGLTIRSAKLTMTHPNSYRYGGITVPVLDLFFECRVVDASKLELVDGELSDWQWTRPTPEHLQQMAFHSNRLALQHWLTIR